MESPLQQRIVGAVVLVTLGVIFIPALLDGSGYKSRQVQHVKIKDKPAFPPLSQKKLKPIATPREISKASQTKKAATGSISSKKKVIKSFALQVGTFATNENAEKLQNKLRKAGYTTFVHKIQAKGKPAYQVRIGPELEFKLLEKIKKEVNKTQKIDGYIVNHP